MHDRQSPMETFLELMHVRFACKSFTSEPLGSAQIRMILEAGRLSPTSFGLEGWRFHVVTDPAMRKDLAAACFAQESVASAAVNIIITALRAESYAPYGAFVAQRGIRFPGTVEAFIDDYVGYHQFLQESGRIECWSRSQCYIAAANMMNAAATEGIQSCAIEGFKEEEVIKVLGIDAHVWQVGLVIPFGLPAEPVRPKIREPLEHLVEYH